jgi:hypothetical protein
MGRVALTEDGDGVAVLLTARSDYVALRAVFRDTPGSADPREGEEDLFEIPLDHLANVRALWAAGFEWRRKGMVALIDRLLAAAPADDATSE